MDNRQITAVSGVITTADGKTREFQILPEYGWSQWGGTASELWPTVEPLEVMSAALSPFFAKEG